MSNMPQEEQFGVFGIVMATVCIPFFLLIGSLNTTQGMAFWRKKYRNVITWIVDRDRSGKKHAEVEGSDDDDDDTESKNVPGRSLLRLGSYFADIIITVRLKTHKRSFSTTLAIQKRQEQTKPLNSAPAPPPLAKLRSRSNSEFKRKSEDEHGERGRRKIATPSDQNRPGSEMIIVEMLPENNAGVEKRRVVAPSEDGLQTGSATTSRRQDEKEKEKEAGWWERIVGRRRKKNEAGRNALDV